MEDYLAHHGIPGQKHGVRNGPPYPLSRSQKSAKEKRLSTAQASGSNEKVKSFIKKAGDSTAKVKKKIQEKKEAKANDTSGRAVVNQNGTKKVLKKANAVDVYKHMNQLTNEELQAYITRVNLEKQIRTLALEEKKMEQQIYDKKHPVKTAVRDFLKDEGGKTAKNLVAGGIAAMIASEAANHPDDPSYAAFAKAFNVNIKEDKKEDKKN